MTVQDFRAPVPATGPIEVGERGQHLDHGRMAVAVPQSEMAEQPPIQGAGMGEAPGGMVEARQVGEAESELGIVPPLGAAVEDLVRFQQQGFGLGEVAAVGIETSQPVETRDEVRSVVAHGVAERRERTFGEVSGGEGIPPAAVEVRKLELGAGDLRMARSQRLLEQPQSASIEDFGLAQLAESLIGAGKVAHQDRDPRVPGFEHPTGELQRLQQDLDGVFVTSGAAMA
jgi:hypothetical protein